MALFFMNGTVFGQAEQKKITMKVTDVTVLDALYEVNRLCGNLIFFMKEEVGRENTLVSVDVENLSLLETVKKIIEGTSLACIEKNGRLIVAPAVQMPVTVCGFVTDQRKSPMPGATVMVKGLTLGTVTDSRGWYKLSVPHLKDFTLVFSFIGMKEAERKYAGKDTINIILYEDVQAMDEVVVTGYGNVSKGSYTGASTTVKASDVMMAGVSSIDQMLQGVVPGMLVMNKTGMVGASPKIRVRGTSTLLGSQEPVWVVDGVIQRDPQPFNSEDNTKFSVDADDIRQLAGNAVSWLNPNDIETITVLKDASATAIYGSQAANGVIVITTKKAKVGKISVNYNGDFSIGQRPRYGLYDLMNSAERMQLSKEIYEERREFTNGSVVLPIGYEGLLQKLFNKEITHEEMASEYEKMARQNTDWFDILFRNSFNHSHSLGISGGSEKIQNRTSFGFIQENGEAKGNGMTQFTASSNTTINLWDRVTINMLLNGSVREVDGFAYGVDPFNYAYNTSRVIPAYNEDGSLFYHEKQGEGSAAISNKSTYNYNILNERSTTGSESRTRNWGTTIDLKWQILPGLEYQGLVAYNSSSSDTKQHATERSFYISSIRGYEYGTIIENTSDVGVTPLPMGGVFNMFLKPEEIRAQIDLLPEKNKFVRVLERESGEKTFLRVYNDMGHFPREAEITAAFKRIVMDLPKVGFLTGHGERDIKKLGDRDYNSFTLDKSFRYALINQGFDIENVTLDKEVNPEIRILVIAEVRDEMSEVECENLDKYIACGGNLLIMNEPKSAGNIEPLLAKLGVKVVPGTLVRQTENFSPDLILSSPTKEAGEMAYWFENMIKENQVIVTPGVSGLEYSTDKGYQVTPLFLTDSLVWNELETTNFVDDAIELNEEAGEVQQRYATGLALTRKLGDKEQKIMIFGDADCISNGELGMFRQDILANNFNIVMGSFFWMSDEEVPVDVRRLDPLDNQVYMDEKGLATWKVIMMWIIPGLLVIFSILIWIRRRGR
ncbi:SusC/RagA family TonB-linked outer membrane protein [Butyricimonas virosa]|jgi:TonB-dependent SusC/RagA subfamily outer membrane receptor|uniref:SusC/RagA family TonB-linked outer membrane protein n=1 Tax=Butyricimonas virosa TaxID=544645 RepID=UPI0022E69747|nr:SusC/RagA family TonB-linked outer membrane protein [Butyricimonas virosa]MCI6414807.1 SusC/RagA family TonB-linked outer membrane protein [Butyricimonas virosa]